MSRPRIVVMGSLNMDLVVTMDRLPRLGESIQGKSIHYVPGGKGANQAVGCARLGADVSMIGAVGRDAFGERIVEQLTRFGANASNVAALADEPTGTATILHAEGDNCIVIVPGANGRCDEEMIERASAVIGEADVLIVQLEVPIPTVRKALDIARARGVTTILNPAPALPLPDDVIALADYFTPNETEFESYGGASVASEAELTAAMKAWQERFRHTLVVTRGKEGVSCARDGEIAHYPTRPAEVVDTTGAGDCFNAALAYGLASGWPLDRCLPFAVSAASLSVTKFGAQDGMPTLGEVERAR